MPLNLFRTPSPGLGKVTAEQNISPMVRRHIQLIQFSALSGDIPWPQDSSSLKSMAFQGLLSLGCFPCAKEPSVAFSYMDLSSLCLSPWSLPWPCCLPISAFPTFQQWVCFSWRLGPDAPVWSVRWGWFLTQCDATIWKTNPRAVSQMSSWTASRHFQRPLPKCTVSACMMHKYLIYTVSSYLYFDPHMLFLFFS